MLSALGNHTSFKRSDALCDLVPFVSFEKHKKHPWMYFTFSKACNITKRNTCPWVFSHF